MPLTQEKIQKLYSRFKSWPRGKRYAILGSVVSLSAPLGYSVIHLNLEQNRAWWEFFYVLLGGQIAFVLFGYLLGSREERLKNSKNQLKQEVHTINKELKHTHEQLMHTTKLASVGELAASVAHELRQPLTIITGYCEEVLSEHQDELSPEAHDMVSKILEQAQFMATISSSLRDFSRKETPEFQPMSVNPTIQKVLAFYSQQFKNRHIRFYADLTPNLPNIYADPTQVQQVLINLTNNAIDVLEGSGGRVTFRSFLDKEYHLILQVINDGPPISDEIRSKIFNPFYTTKPTGKGTGLGLSISQSIIEQHGGVLRLEEDMDETVFTMVFPVLVMPIASNLNFLGKVLVIDDNPDILKILSRKLARLGLDVDEANNYKEAISKIQSNGYDLIFSDFNLDGRHGGYVLRQLRKDHPDTPFYFISRYLAMVRPELQKKFLEMATGWVEKPFSEQQLMNILQKHLKHEPRTNSEH